MIRTMIFDLDGTLVQSEKLKAISYARAVMALDPTIREDEVLQVYRAVVGRSRYDVAMAMLERFHLSQAASARRDALGVTTDWQAFGLVRLAYYEELVACDEVVLAHRWPFNLALLHRARRSCERIGLATMSHCKQVRHILSVLQLMDTFDFVASGDDVEHGKPDPAIYRLVAAELDTSPDECLVIEDSVAGVTAALAAGMHCIAVPTPYTATALHQTGLLEKRWIVDDPATVEDVVATLIKETTGHGR